MQRLTDKRFGAIRITVLVVGDGQVEQALAIIGFKLPGVVEQFQTLNLIASITHEHPQVHPGFG
jgi:hypothetical protein